MLFSKISEHIIKPVILVESSRFMVKLANNPEEIESAQRLRYEIFNLEQGRGLKSVEKYGIDFDEFDEHCLHLIAIEKETGNVIGTYRALLGSVANAAKGFYSSREYDIKGLYKIADKCLELGRSCIAPKFRNGSIVELLWRAITELLKRANLTFMLGCVSLEETDPSIGWALYRYLHQKNSTYDGFMVTPRSEFQLKKPPDYKIEKLLSDETLLKKYIPPLFKSYLRFGALVCGEPAIDKEFGTIDFFIFVDISRVPKRYLRHFNYLRSKNN